uniref:F-box domain-containing protein n=1 Tax=Brassica oleracea var. oleracea TaxID=109376 RepID=A0A0D3E846_BRAOL
MSSRNLKMRRRRELPFELVVEILTRVPVKDLMRFRCVCKSWRSLFKEERFCRQHMTRAPTRIVSFHFEDTLLLGRFSESAKPEMMILEEVSVNVGDDSSLLNDTTVVLGHCHGLFCLYFENNTFGLWNPSLRELRTIHPPYRYNWYEMGFGYDHSSQDYKIVLVLKMQGRRSRSSQALVLSLKSGVSRMINCLCLENFDMIHDTISGTLVGETIYWQLCDDNVKVTDKLLSFDLVSETFNLCPCPSNCGKGLPQVIAGLRGGGLCIVGVDDMSGGLIVWSAQHDGGGGIKSWSKICNLSLGILEISASCRIDDKIWLSSAVTYAGLLLALVKFGRESKLLSQHDGGGGIKSWSKICNLSLGILEISASCRIDDKIWLSSAVTYAGLLLALVKFGRESKLLSYNLEEKSLTNVETSLSLSTCDFLETYVETLVPVPIPEWKL